MKGAERVQGLTESVIREMTRKAIRNDAINLSQGYPDYPTPEDVKTSAKRAIDGDFNQYSITWGLEELRERIAKKLNDFNRLRYDPEMEITITCGTSEALMSSILGLVDIGEEVLVFQPFYENYVPAVSMASGKPVFTSIDKDLNLDKEEIKSKVGENTKAMILNTPHNPSGKVFSIEELRFLRDLCVDHDILVLTDEIYERIIYEGEHVSMATLDGMKERTITAGGFSKAYSMTGWRVGYAAGPRDMMKPVRKAHDYTTVCAPTPFQKGVTGVFDLSDDYYRSMVDSYREARDLLYEGLIDTDFQPTKPKGAYYMLAGIDRFDMDDTELADHLVKDVGVAVVPGSSFYEDGGREIVRFCFSQDPEDLKEVIERLKRC